MIMQHSNSCKNNDITALQHIQTVITISTLFRLTVMNTLCLCDMKTSYCTIEGISHGTSAVSWPSRVIQMSKSLCLKPNPFLDEPNKTNLAPVYKKYTLTNKYLYSPPITYKTYKTEKEKLRNIQHTNLALE